jgi:hypothetical protein
MIKLVVLVTQRSTASLFGGRRNSAHHGRLHELLSLSGSALVSFDTTFSSQHSGAIALTALWNGWNGIRGNLV